MRDLGLPVELTQIAHFILPRVQTWKSQKGSG